MSSWPVSAGPLLPDTGASTNMAPDANAVSALICRAATEADIDPDRVKFKRTVRVVRRRVTDLNPLRRHRSYPRVV